MLTQQKRISSNWYCSKAS